MLRNLAWIAALLAAPALASAQIAGAVDAPAVGICVDKVRISEFGMKPSAPAPSTVAVLAVTITNLCAGTSAASVLTVPWRITVGKTTLRSSIVLIPPASSAIGTVNWTASAGTFSFDAEADPANTLGEPAAARANNLTDGFSVTIRAPKKSRPSQNSPSPGSTSEEK